MNDFSRRDWLKGMSLAVLGSVVFYDLGAKPSEVLVLKGFELSPAQDAKFKLCIDTILPESKIPGAISLGVPVFVQTMLSDCYTPQAQSDMKAFLDSLDQSFQSTYTKKLSEASVGEKEAFLFQIASGSFGDNAKKALETLKGLTIQGFMTSEKIMTEQLNYVMAPGFFNGCAPIKK